MRASYRARFRLIEPCGSFGRSQGLAAGVEERQAAGVCVQQASVQARHALVVEGGRRTGQQRRAPVDLAAQAVGFGQRQAAVAILHQLRHHLAMARNPCHREDDQHHGQRQDRPQQQLNAQAAQLTQHGYLSSSTIQPSLSAVVTASVRELTPSLP